jgi:hypothetical protein
VCEEISPFHVTQNVVYLNLDFKIKITVIVISLGENVFDLGVTQIPLFEELLDLFESVGSVAVLVRQMVHELLLCFKVSSIGKLKYSFYYLVLFFLSLFLDFVHVSL